MPELPELRSAPYRIQLLQFLLPVLPQSISMSIPAPSEEQGGGFGETGGEGPDAVGEDV